MTRAFGGLIAAALLLLGSGPAGAAYKEAPVLGGGSVSGKVAFRGSPPPPVKLLLTKDHAVCGKGQIERREVDVKDGALRGVVVFLEKVKKGKPFAKAASKAVVDQRKCIFTPAIQVARNKSKLTILNSDPVLHNIHAYELIGSVRRSMFNLAQPRSKPKRKKKLRVRRTGFVRLECDAHNWMVAFLFVAKNPYYAIVGADGSFRIGDIPPGAYTLKAWHPELGVRKQKITVKKKGKTAATFTFSAK